MTLWRDLVLTLLCSGRVAGGGTESRGSIVAAGGGGVRETGECVRVCVVRVEGLTQRHGARERPADNQRQRQTVRDSDIEGQRAEELKDRDRDKQEGEGRESQWFVIEVVAWVVRQVVSQTCQINLSVASNRSTLTQLMN